MYKTETLRDSSLTSLISTFLYFVFKEVHLVFILSDGNCRLGTNQGSGISETLNYTPYKVERPTMRKGRPMVEV